MAQDKIKEYSIGVISKEVPVAKMVYHVQCSKET